jgi:hypothetical protein
MITSRRGLAETEHFTRALINLAAQGLRTHCSDPGTSELWLSEHKAERREAAKLCRGCPVIEQCGRAAEARDEKFGVWAAVDRTRLPSRPGWPATIQDEPDEETVA